MSALPGLVQAVATYGPAQAAGVVAATVHHHNDMDAQGALVLIMPSGQRLELVHHEDDGTVTLTKILSDGTRYVRSTALTPKHGQLDTVQKLAESLIWWLRDILEAEP